MARQHAGSHDTRPSCSSSCGGLGEVQVGQIVHRGDRGLRERKSGRGALSRKDGLGGRGAGAPGQVTAAPVNETAGRTAGALRKACDSASRRCGIRRIQVDECQVIRFVSRSGSADENSALKQTGIRAAAEHGSYRGSSQRREAPSHPAEERLPSDGSTKRWSRARVITNTVRGASGAVSIRQRPRIARGGGGRCLQGAGKSKGVACGIG